MAGKAREDRKEERKVELGRVGRKCKGHWVNGIENPQNNEQKIFLE